MEFAIQTRSLTKIFPSGTVGISGLDLEIPAGTVYGLMGRNGAGKTTVLRLLMGLLQPNEGEALIFGRSLWNAPRSFRARVSYVAQGEQMPGWMALRELCRYASSFYDRWNQAFAEDLARRWNIPWTRPLATLSGGEQRKAAIILALAPDPAVLLLDEPAAGLDPLSRRELISEFIGVLNRHAAATVVFSTHITSDLERIAQAVGIIERGRLVVNRALDELQATFRRIQVIFPGEAPPPRFNIPGALRTTVAGPVVTGVTEYFDAEHLEALARWPGVRVQSFPLGLEEIFLEVVRRKETPQPQGEPAIFADVLQGEEKIVCL